MLSFHRRRVLRGMFYDRNNGLKFFIYLVILATAVFHNCIPDIIPVANGFGWDGDNYARYAKQFPGVISERRLNSYDVQKILPSALIACALKILQLPPTDQAIIVGFSILNLALVFLSIHYWAAISETLRLRLSTQWIGFASLFLNYAVLKNQFYYPVSTDTAAFTIGVMMLFYYLHSNPFRLLAATCLGAFCYPTLLICGLILYCFPFAESSTQRRQQSSWNRLFAIVASAGALVLIATLQFQGITHLFKPVDDVTFTISLLMLLGYVFVVSDSLVNLKDCFRFIRDSASFKRFSIACGTFLAVKIAISCMSNRNPLGFSVVRFVTHLGLESVANPLVFLVAHFVYFGPSLLVLIFYWRELAQSVYRLGMGAQILLFMYVLLAIGSESRQYVNAWPFFVAALCVTLDRYEFPRGFITVMLGLSFIDSKVWYRINAEPFVGDYLTFPWQRYFMSHGPWMSDTSYVVQGLIAVCTGLLLHAYLRKSVVRPEPLLHVPHHSNVLHTMSAAVISKQSYAT